MRNESERGRCWAIGRVGVRFESVSSLKFCLLGPLEVASADQAIVLPAEKPRALLAYLLLNANTPISSGTLIEALWDDPPKTALNALHVYVSRLRKALSNGEGDLLVTHPAGYSLHVEPDQLDLHWFERFVAEARDAQQRGDAAAAADRLRRGLGLWRGQPLADLPDAPFARVEALRLEELRLSALEDRIEADLELRRHGDLVAELESLVAQHPLRERLRGQLMLALYRSGRQADALEKYRDARVVLVDTLGLDPGPALQELERAILRQDRELSAPAAPTAERAGLPSSASPLVGREQELAWASALVRRPDVRLLTITGVGGIGKTRLALELARNLSGMFEDGAAFVSLETISDPELVVPTIARALGPLAAPGSTDAERLRDYLATRSLLLVLDSFEQLLEAAPVVSDLAAGAPGLKVVVASRALLRVSGEYNFELPPLELPRLGATPQELATVPSVSLFVQRAQAVVSDFALTHANAADVAELCRRLEGIPLAIELAARRTKVLAPGPMLARLSQRLDLLAGGLRDAPERQQTLRATIDWSYDLLDENEQALFARLSVFVGGCTLASAEAICGEDVMADLASLVDKSLLRRRSGADPRFVMLDTVQEYALDLLGRRGEKGELQRRHAEHFLGVADAAKPELTGPRQAAWFDRLAEEHDNLRGALRWFLDGRRGELALRMVTALTRFWDVRGHRGEAMRWLTAALGARPRKPTPNRAIALRLLGILALREGRGEEAIPWIEESLRILEERKPDDACPTLLALSQAHLLAGHNDRAAELATEALEMAKRLGERRSIAHALDAAGNISLVSGGFEQARREFEATAAIAAELDDLQFLAVVLHNLACALIELGRVSEAVRTLRRSLRIARDVGFKLELVYCLEACAALLLATGDYRSAARLLGAAERLAELELVVVAEPYEAATHRRTLAALETALGETGSAAALSEGRLLTSEDAVDEALALLARTASAASPPA